MFSIQSLLVMMIIVVAVLFVFRKIDGKKGTWDTTDDIEEHAVLHLTADEKERPKKKKQISPESNGEREARAHLQKRFAGEKFEKARPEFLKNPITNNNLELDCYCPRLNLALEYNGKQHYEWVPKFQKTRTDFLNQKYRDDIKRRLCKENGVDLIEVPYKVENIPLFIDTELEKLGKIRLL